MPIVWRLVRAEFSERLDGEGARLFGGRWNSRGRPAVYTSAHLSLSVLEVYVHIPPALRDELPVLRAVQISIPDGAETFRIPQRRLASLLSAPDALAECRAAGDAWLERGEELVLQVPSILVPEESNFILDPTHPRMTEVRIMGSREFRFDPRLSVGKA